jgi:hypothetical protein
MKAIFGYSHLAFICILVLLFWYFASSCASGQALNLKSKPTLPDGYCYAPGLEILSSGRQWWISHFMCDATRDKAGKRHRFGGHLIKAASSKRTLSPIMVFF